MPSFLLLCGEIYSVYVFSGVLWLCRWFGPTFHNP
jgi:hypothetical protein